MTRTSSSHSANLDGFKDSRWLHVFAELFDCIVKTFNEVQSLEVVKGFSRQCNVIKAMLSFECILTLHIVEWYVSYTESVTRALYTGEGC